MTNIMNKTRIDLYSGFIEYKSIVLDGDNVEIELEKRYTNRPWKVCDYVTTPKDIFISNMAARYADSYHLFSRDVDRFSDEYWEQHIQDDLISSTAVLNFLREVCTLQVVEVEEFLKMSRAERDDYLKAAKGHRAEHGTANMAVWAYNAVAYIWSRQDNWADKVELDSMKGQPHKIQIALKQALDLFIHSETCLAA